MRIQLDENMPAALGDLLRSAGHDPSTVAKEGLSGAADTDVIEVARAEGRLLFTFDLDFADVRAYPPGSRAGIVVFRLADQRWSVVQAPARRSLEVGLLDRLERGLAIVDEARIRIRRIQGD